MFLPEQTPWRADLEAALFASPGGRHDDQVPRRGDAVKLGPPHVKARVARITTEKTDERVAISFADELAQVWRRVRAAT